MNPVKLLFIAGAALLAAACATPTPKDYSAFRQADPKSILVVPVVNNSVNLQASDYFISTVTVPLAERGFYVFPVNAVKRVMEDDGLADAAMVHNADPTRLGEVFGADAILYITVDRWDSQYLVLNTTTTVSTVYTLRDGRSGETLWVDAREFKYSPQASGGGIGALIAQAVVSAVEKADPSYMPLARQANAAAFYSQGSGLPAGPHSPAYLQDLDVYAAQSGAGTAGDSAAATEGESPADDAAESD